MRITSRLNVWMIAAIALFATALYGDDYCTPNQVFHIAPVAVDDLKNITAVGVGVLIPVLNNDVAGTTGTLMISSVSAVTPSTTSNPSMPYGTVVRNADNTLTYTPNVLADASFTYTIADPAQPDAPSLPATVILRAPVGDVQIIQNCSPAQNGVGTDGVCTFNAVAQITQGIRSYSWTWGDQTAGQPVVLSDKVSHQYNADGQYHVTVTVSYFSGDSRTGSTDVTVHYSAAATWDPIVPNGLSVEIRNIRGLSTFPPGTTPAANWSANAADCQPTGTEPAPRGCGPGVFVDGGSCPQNECMVTFGSYARSGTYNAILRFHILSNFGQTEQVIKDYPLVITVQNKAPVVSFTTSRTTPNARDYWFVVSAVDDGPYPLTYVWDFGDGTTLPDQQPVSHTYLNSGDYTVALKVGDQGGKSTIATNTVTVTNSPPVPAFRSNCVVLPAPGGGYQCTFGSEPSVDDGQITAWDWTFGDATTASGATVTKTYTAAGCYDVVLKETDAEGTPGTGHQLVTVGPPIQTNHTGVVVDAHLQSYYAQVNGVTGWFTTTGNLNGIVEPGETVVVEPTWPTTPDAQIVSVLVNGLTTTDWSYASPEFRHSLLTPGYDVSTGKADCWSPGDCYVLKVTDRGTGHSHAHNDVQFGESYLTTGLPTPGSPIIIHVGKSFDDVPVTHWAYPLIESILHSGIDGGCGGLTYCPDTQVSRGELARWLLRAEHGAGYQPPACQTAPFNDVPCTHPMATWIAQLKTEGIASGSSFTPDAAVTRSDASVLLLKTKLGASYTPPSCSADFGDVVCPSAGADWISDMRARGISNGCSLTEFCPTDPVDRSQAAAFVSKAFGLRIDSRECSVDPPYDRVLTHPVRDPIVSITFNPSPAIIGSTSIGTITLGLPPARATNIPLSIDNSSAASIPATVLVNADQTVGTFVITPANVSTRTTTNITATYLAFPKTASLDICTLAPAISAQPVSKVVNNGQPATLSVTAAGGGVLTYQWYQGTLQSPIAVGTNSNTLSVTPAATTSYWVVVTNACAGTTSSMATVTVCYPPAIGTQPFSQIISSGTTATLTTTVTGSGPFAYQWYEGTPSNTTTLVPGATGTTFTTSPLTVNKSYWMRATSTCNGTATADSIAATITVVTQITRVQTAATTAQSQIGVTTNWPQPTHAGNLLVAVISASNNNYPVATFAPPPGWQLASWTEWNKIKTAIYYYPNSPAGRPSETFNVGTGNYRDLVLQLAEYTWMDATAPFDASVTSGDNAPANGLVSTGNTPATTQAKELVLSALTTYAPTSFSNPTNSFVEMQDQAAGNNLTTAVHERIVAATGAYGHSATVGGAAQWIGVVTTFKGSNAPPPPPPIVSLTFTPSPAASGGSSTGTITLGAAPSSATNIPLTIDNAAAATIPATVLVNSGQTTGAFTVTPASVSVRTTTNITATYLGYPKTTALDICPPAPTISTQPASVFTTGGATTLSVTASGGALTYQWYQGAAPSTATPLGTGSTQTVAPSTTTSYWVNVTNGCASAASSTATVTVCSPLGIATQPASQTITSGSTATLSVTPSGSGPFAYQWYEGTAGSTTTPVPGANASTFTTPALTVNKSYWVRITSNCNGTTTADSNTAVLTVVTQITRVQTVGATAQSQTGVTATWPQATHAGNLLIAVVSASNNSYPIATFTPPPGWQLANWTEWSNVKTAIYYYPNCPASRPPETFSTGAGNYRDLVLQLAEYAGVLTAAPFDNGATNGDNVPASGVISTGNTPTTSQAKELVISALTTYAAVTISSPTNSFVQVQNQTVGNDLTTAVHERMVTTAGAYGHSATVSAPAQWIGVVATFKGSNGPPPAITSLTFSPSPAAFGGSSTGTITLGSAPSSATNIPLSIDNPAAATIPATVLVNSGQTTGTFTVTPANVSTRTTTNITATYLGFPKTTALDICTPAPTISAQPTSRVINASQPTTLSVTASGGGAITYQWYQGTAPSTATPLGTASTLTVTPAATTNYWVNVTNACSSTASSTATVTVCGTPGFATQPASQTITSGTTATLSVTASGSGPFGYQWYEGTSGTATTPVPGATASSFTTPALTVNKSYWVRITSACNGSATADSNTAAITIVTQVTRVQSTASTVQSQVNVTASWPQATHVGNLLIAVISASNNSYPVATFTPPPGWQLANWTEWNNVKTAIYYYPNCPAGRPPETFSVGTGNYRDLVLQLAEYAGVMATSPFDKGATNGGNAPTGGVVSTGNTPTTAQSKELVITALTTYAVTSFTSPTNSFVKIQDQTVGNNLTTAVHERIVTAAGAYGHNATVGGNTQWIGVVATFKSVDSSALFLTRPAWVMAELLMRPPMVGGPETKHPK